MQNDSAAYKLVRGLKLVQACRHSQHRCTVCYKK